MWILMAWLGGCGNGTTCDKVMNDFCALEAACGRAASETECLSYFAENYTCNDKELLAASRAACSDRLTTYVEVQPQVCYDRFPEECSDVICDQVKGCDFETTTDGETGVEVPPPPHTGKTGGTGAATHSGGEN